MIQKTLRHISLLLTISSMVQARAPLGLFDPYDINILQKKPGFHGTQLGLFVENSQKVKGFATDEKEEKTCIVNPLEIYERSQNFIGIYQSSAPTNLDSQSTQLMQLLDSITAGPGGGIVFNNDVALVPRACLSGGQVSIDVVRGIGKGFYVSVYVPFRFAKLSNLSFDFNTSSSLFSDFALQEKITSTYIEDAKKYFDLDIRNWKDHGFGDVTVFAEWQRTFIQRRPTLKQVEAILRVGLSFPTSKAEPTNLIMPVSFGNEGSWAIPFGGGLTINLMHFLEFGFAGQFEYIFSNEQLRRIKTFSTQTSLLYPSVVLTYKNFAIIQNLSLHATIYSKCNRFSIKNIYSYYRKPTDTLIPLLPIYNAALANSAAQLNETTLHQYSIFGRYSPQSADFNKVFPQFSIFYKVSFNGMRCAAVCSYGAELSITF